MKLIYLDKVPVVVARGMINIDRTTKEFMMKSIFMDLDIHNQQHNSVGALTSFKLHHDVNGFLDHVYTKFLELSESIFGDLTLLDRNSRRTWCLCTNKDYYASVKHDHLENSTINGVYYFNIPKMRRDEGRIVFYHNGLEHKYHPREGDFVLFPNYLVHNTEYHDTEEYRISINQEILCNPVNWSNLNAKTKRKLELWSRHFH